MRKKIKVKVKYLIIIPIVIFIIFPNILYGIGRTMYLMNFSVNDSSRITSRQYSYGVFKLYTEWPKISPFKGDAYFYLGKLTYDYDAKVITNGMRDNIIGYLNEDLGSYEEAVEFHELGLKYSDGIDYSLNATALFNLYLENEDRESAEKIIENSLKEESFRKNSAGKVLDMQLSIIDGEKEKFEEKYREISKKAPNGGFYKYVLGEEGEYFQSQKLGEKIYFFDEKQLLKTLMNSMAIFQLEDRYASSEVEEESCKVKGKITLEGKPLKNIPVAIGNVLYYGDVLSGKIMQSYGKIVYTNEKGEIEVDEVEADNIINVSPIVSKRLADKYTVEEAYIRNWKKDGEYTLNLDFKKRLNINIQEEGELKGDKFSFTFDKVEEADYYDVRMEFIHKGGYGYSVYAESSDNKLELPLIEGCLSSVEGIEGRGESVDSSNLGLYKGETIERIQVKAMKGDKGRDRVLNSREIKTKIKNQKRSLSEGEELIKRGKMDEGVEWFSNKIKEEGYKKEYIYPLLIIASRTENHDEFLEMQENLDKRKEFFSEERLEKAKKAEEVLLKELYKINGSDDEIEYFKGRYRDLYMRYGIIKVD